MLVRHVRLRLRLIGCRSSLAHFHATASARKKRTANQKTFKLADIGEGITECEVIKWSVQPRSQILAFDPLCEVQSDKASVEITSPWDGVVTELLVKEGEIAKVGEGLCVVEVEEEEEGGGGGGVVDSNNNDNSSTGIEPPVQKEPSRNDHPLDPNNNNNSSHNENILATPSTRHFARQQGVDLARLAPGSGKNGRVERSDLEAHLLALAEARKEEKEERKREVAEAQGGVVVELGRTRYAMWKAMVKSLEIPHFGYTSSLDLTRLHALLPILNKHIPSHFLPAHHHHTPPYPTHAVNPSALYPAHSATQERVPPSQQFTRLTYLPFLLKTLSKAMLEWPIFRASLNHHHHENQNKKPTLTIRPTTDIALALSTPTGLYTPTLPAVSSLSIYAIASQIHHLAHLGRQVPCGLSLGEMPSRADKRGTITLSNIGAIGAGESAVPLLGGEGGGGLAIVAVGRAKWVWDVDGDGVSSEDGKGKWGERRLKVNVSWSADHRVVEGAEMAAFVECWRGWVEEPERLIAEGV